jgi:hypothetical protein
VIIAWNEMITSSPYMYSNYSRTRPSASGTWSPPAKISQDNTSSYRPILAAGNNGTVLAVYVKGMPAPSSDYAWYANVRDAGGIWGSETQLSSWASSSPFHGGGATIGVWPDGTCLVTWNMLDASRNPNQDEAVFWNTRSPGGSWAGQGRLSHWYDFADAPNLGMGLDGSAVVLWAAKDAYQPANHQTAIMEVHFPPSGPWTDENTVSDWDSYSSMFPFGLAVHPAGQPVGVTWYQSKSASERGFFYSQFSTGEVGGKKVYLPMVLR